MAIDTAKGLEEMKNKLLAILAVGLLAGPMASQATIVNFDSTEVPGLSSGQSVTNQWAAYGIALASAYWYVDSRDPFDQQGVANQNTGRIDFASAAQNVGLDWISITSAIYIDAYDFSNSLLVSFTSTASSGSASFGSGVAYLTWRDSGGTVGISTLRYDLPEPSTLALLGLGLLGLGFSKRRKLS